MAAHEDFCNSEIVPCSKMDCATCKVLFMAALNWWKKSLQPTTAKGQNLPLDCIGIKSDADSAKLQLFIKRC